MRPDHRQTIRDLIDSAGMADPETWEHVRARAEALLAEPLPAAADVLRSALMEHTPDNVGESRVDRILLDVWPTIEPLLYANRWVNDVRQTWQQVAEATIVERNEYSARVQVLSDLDRCQHGRHEGDDCFGCDGPSEGNPFRVDVAREAVLTHRVLSGQAVPIPDRTIGFGLDASPIVVPAPRQMHDADAWRVPRG